MGSQTILMELVDPQPGESVLDVGTGSGGLALLAARAGARVRGIDVAEDGIERARARAAEADLDVRFDVGDAQSLPYAAAAFDVVVSTFGVIFAPDQRRAARELARVCRPGGRLGLTLMPMDSRTGETFSILREFGGGDPGDHPAVFADRLDEDGDLEHAVLLRAGDFLARIEEDTLGKRILEQKELDVARLVDFVDHEPPRDGLVQADVFGLWRLGGEEREQRESAERAGLTELERKGLRLCLHAS